MKYGAPASIAAARMIQSTDFLKQYCRRWLSKNSPPSPSAWPSAPMGRARRSRSRPGSTRSPDERSDIRVFIVPLNPAYRFAHAGYGFSKPTTSSRGAERRSNPLSIAVLWIASRSPSSGAHSRAQSQPTPAAFWLISDFRNIACRLTQISKRSPDERSDIRELTSSEFPHIAWN
jgi:hypothetical protein